MSETQDWQRPAPGDLALVQRLINTADLEDAREDLGDPEALAAWLRDNGLGGGEGVDAGDLARVLEFREALRRLLLSHNGAEIDRDAVAALDRAARDVQLVVGFGPGGTPRLTAAGGGVNGALGRLLAIIARADADGTWARLKTCPAADCMWAFYDFSRNHSRTWCSMTVCGNRAKARTYRRRAARLREHE